ncbi:MAG: hypothetical protein NVS4B3_03620 [Gemmatimonadaceae bacterium]
MANLVESPMNVLPDPVRTMMADNDLIAASHIVATSARAHQRIMKLAGRATLISAVAALVSGLNPWSLSAQSAGDLAAWDALMLSPVGALPPQARQSTDDNIGRNELSLRYGRWKYDLDDAVHNNIGLTYSRRLAMAQTEIAFTGGYLSLSCAMCASWVSGGVDVQSTVWRHPFAAPSEKGATGSIGLRAGIGGARYLGVGHAVASSASTALAFGFGVPALKSSRLLASIIPGFGFGRIASVDEKAQGVRFNVGSALAWTFASGFGIDLGAQKIVIAGGPTQVGMGMSWRDR